MRFMQTLARFLYGRYAMYGIDILNKLLAILAVALSAINLFLGSYALYIIQSALVFWLLFRLLSRNISARRAENQVFSKFIERVKTSFNISKRRFKERSTHVYKTCPSCKAKLRFPRKKGTHNAFCPRCKTSFTVRVR